LGLLVSSGITPANVELATKLNKQIDKKYFTVISILAILENSLVALDHGKAAKEILQISKVF
jgi:hypothetical protein